MNDVIDGAGGSDIIWGGAGSDTLTGGSDTSDTFVFKMADVGHGVDTITDFNADSGTGDVINLADVLTGYDSVTQALSDFVKLDTNGSDTTISVDIDGAGTAHAWTQIATLSGITGLTDADDLVTNGNLIVAG